jgi:ketosteroid isomerase-like protein
VIRRGYDAINHDGPDAARAFMDPDIVLEMPKGLIDEGSYHGREALMRVWHAYFDEFDEFRWEVERLFGVEDRVFLRVRERGQRSAERRRGGLAALVGLHAARRTHRPRPVLPR